MKQIYFPYVLGEYIFNLGIIPMCSQGTLIFLIRICAYL